MIQSVKWLLVLSLTSILLLACVKKEDDQLACALSVRVLLLKFNITDAATQQDFYFSGNPHFSTKDIYIFKKTDQSRKDTIRPNVMGLGSDRYFSIPLSYNPEETFVLKTGTLPDNTVTYQVGMTKTVCADYQVKQISFNGLAVKADGKGIYRFTR